MRTINATERACVGGGAGVPNLAQAAANNPDPATAAGKDAAWPAGPVVEGTRRRYFIYFYPESSSTSGIPREWLR
ncbi:hypothetical protein GQ57_26000 [Burkholderia sp. MSh2]|uniref:Uncharacterized protein n=1 Tax=Burkholderia paludis TaxID=1506587 RepID=A0A6P2QGG1_9BURK|nr:MULTISPECIES: hypothetical protein [Burkholderia]KEZ03023.1 hypothetical protein GQ57_26000 [Burkholderia sp. MSh2]KFG94770.1 hypothetical protein GQ56_0124040 [Burkholderia paludis]CAB3765767.1 hypothetical protein LMG30113_05048 [Burkholderia paludis]VWC21000.1 hypothetical protein BPA30113_05735 [Burkholderia paludis]